MKTDRDHLDAAIDRVAARMVAVPDAGEMTLRIVSALPERSSRLRWLMPQLAAIGAMAIAALVWATRNNTAPALATLPSTNIAPMTGLVIAVAADDPSREPRRDVAVAASGRLGGRLDPMELAELTSADHERALPAIDALSVLFVTDAQTSDIALPAAIGLASLEVADLKLTAESFTTQKEE